MSGARLEVQWSPIHNNKFITWGTEICLYEVEPLKNYANKSCMRLSETTGAHLLATNSNHHYVKCIDIYPKQNSDLFLAVGQANGRVALTTFGPSEFDSLGLNGRELVPRHARACNAVAWNPIEPNIVAAGLDKYRADHSLLIWDIKKCSIISENNGSARLGSANNSHHNALAAVELPKPIGEFGVSETTNSLAWFITQPRILAVGLNQKSIKIVDFRDSHKVVNSAQTKSVFGLSVHPHNDRHLASFIDNIITVWDTRNFERPILTLTHNKPVIKIHWSLTRHNLLGSLQRDSSIIHLHDIQHTMIGNEEVEPSVLERTVVPGSPHNITSFSWHPQDENRMLTIALSGNITDYVVFERITLNWGPNSNMSWTYGRKTIKYIDDSTGIAHLQDISTKIKQRCLDGYGLKTEFWQNGEIANEPLLANVWNWLYLSRMLVEQGDLRGMGTKHPGVKSVLKLDQVGGSGNSGLKSEIIQTPWLELGNMHCHGSARVYRSEEREKALHLCGWRFDKDSNLFSVFIEKLEKDHAYSRAAAIAVFNLKIRLAIDILNRGAEILENGSNLNIVAMALSGFTDDKNSMWRQFCFNTKSLLTDPYLRALFSFLTAENYNYEHVLNENGLSVDDRVAFACIFLSDKKLFDYLTNLTNKLIEEGNLYGLLLTGSLKEGLTLLQKYLDATGDIQSTTLIAVKAFSPELLQEICVQEWILSYRNLLDSWHFWNQRAHFDIMLSSCSPADKPPQQVYVSCNFCGKSISAYMQGLNRGRGPFSRLGATSNKLKMSSCPNCRKPLPRCAICLMHMGTPSGGPGYTTPETENKMVEFSSWFTWCQSCRHGGHATHMIHWFKEHSECPVTPCTCRCFSVDAVENLVSPENF